MQALVLANRVFQDKRQPQGLAYQFRRNLKSLRSLISLTALEIKVLETLQPPPGSSAKNCCGVPPPPPNAYLKHLLVK